jgi:hypothetical protein
MRALSAMLAASAIALAGPAFAGPGDHGGGNADMHGNMGVGMNAGGFGAGGRVGDMSGRDFGAAMSADGRAMHEVRSTTELDATTSHRSDWRANSQGPAHASATGIAHAGTHSVLAGGTTVVSGPLTGLTVGMNVTDADGRTLGTVQRIAMSKDGTIRNLLVKSSDGSRVYPLGTDSLTLTAGTLVTTSMSRSGR